MLIVALQDNIDDLYAIWNTVTDRFLGVNLTKEKAVKIVADYKKHNFEDEIDRVEHPQPFSDITEFIINGNAEGVYVKCPHCGEIRRLKSDETEELLKNGKQVISDCFCEKLYTVEIDNDAIFTH